MEPGEAITRPSHTRACHALSLCAPARRQPPARADPPRCPPPPRAGSGTPPSSCPPQCSGWGSRRRRAAGRRSCSSCGGRGPAAGEEEEGRGSSSSWGRWRRRRSAPAARPRTPPRPAHPPATHPAAPPRPPPARHPPARQARCGPRRSTPPSPPPFLGFVERSRSASQPAAGGACAALVRGSPPHVFPVLQRAPCEKLPVRPLFCPRSVPALFFPPVCMTLHCRQPWPSCPARHPGIATGRHARILLPHCSDTAVSVARLQPASTIKSAPSPAVRRPPVCLRGWHGAPALYAL